MEKRINEYAKKSIIVGLGIVSILPFGIGLMMYKYLISFLTSKIFLKRLGNIMNRLSDEEKV